MRRAALLLLCVLPAAPAAAATLCVTPQPTSGCTTSIQSAVTAAAAGDLVTVAAGTYFENVVVPAGKDGLQIVGAGRTATVVDPDLPHVSHGFDVQADGVVVKNLAVRNGLAHGIYIQGDGVVVQGCRVVGQRVMGTWGIGAAAGAHGLQILANELRGQRYAAIFLGGGNDDSVVQGNVVSAAPYGIAVVGDRTQVRSNRVTFAQFGLIAQGDDVVLANNTVTASTYGVMSSGGDRATITGNRGVADLYAIAALCSNCTAGLVSGNVATGSYAGIIAQADAPGLVVKSNRANGLEPFNLDGDGVLATLNTAQGASHGRACVRITTNGATVSSNSVTCAGTSFRVQGDSNTLSQNVSVRAGASGFEVDGDAGANVLNALAGNRSLASWGQGFTVHDGANGTGLSGNTATGARVGFCNDNSPFTSTTGNTFGSTSTTCDVLQ